MVTASLHDRFHVPVGGTVILVLSNPRDVFLAEAAALLTGRVPIVSAHPSAKLSLNDFGRTLLPLIENAAPSLIVGDPSYCSYLSSAIGRRVASFDDIDAPGTLPSVVTTDNPTFFIQYSSGTTGTKKGVAISQEQLLWQVDAYAREIGLGPNDHIVSWLPYYHDMGLLTSLLTPLLTGTPITVMSPFDWVKNPLMLLKAITRFFLTTNKSAVKKIIWGADPIQFSPTLPIDIRFQKSPSLFSLLDDNDREGRLGLALETGEDGERHTNTMRVRYSAWDIERAFDPKSGDVIRLFRQRVDDMKTLSYNEANITAVWPQQFLAAKDITHLHQRRLHYLDKFMTLTQQAGCELMIYTNPLHPAMITRLREQTPYLETQALLVDHLRKASQSGVSVQAFTTPADFGGVDADYFDGVHMGRTNGARLLDYVIKQST